MKTHNLTKHLIPLLFACGTFSLTTGVIAAVQNDRTETGKEPPSDEISQAVQTAQSWLSLIDAGQYEKSYNQMDKHIGNHNLTLPDWAKSCNSMKTHFGIITGRRYIKIEMLAETPGLPKNSWMIVTFHAETSAPLIREYIKATGTGTIPGGIAASEGKLIESVVLIKQPKNGEWLPAGRILDIPEARDPAMIPSKPLLEQ
ncbi:DUF4019 domain-containing protein [Akkermansia glycaniphila]|uniref:Uncharacterized protein n=1 Tax=Akkermansia glycaniphila TaxID=1679444 RepID=A0A1C7PDU6_9BACT|nr:DUF4019 domain-containing protein [Akkermansia glycaniphila]MBT9449449.1 DUF4019 domain-containing protein [Akkermansia glycaniphila]OCA03721.1 hypothetical protein AC781_03255 [Akkermansia glycaniphila]SEH82754.1 protein of unknown function (duf4019) [Akkermansia glycaniphila]